MELRVTNVRKTFFALTLSSCSLATSLPVFSADYVSKASQAAKAGDYDLAEKYCTMWVDSHPSDEWQMYRAYNYRSTIRRCAMKYSGAIEDETIAEPHLLRSSQLVSGSTHFWGVNVECDLAKLYAVAGRSGAEEHLERANAHQRELTTNMDPAGCLNNYVLPTSATIALLHGDFQKALSFLDQVKLSGAWQTADINNLKALCYIGQKEYDKALPCLDQSIKKYPQNSFGLALRCAVHHLMGHDQLAKEDEAKIVTSKMSKVAASELVYKSDWFANNSQWGIAAALADTGLRFFPEGRWQEIAFTNRSRALLKLNQFDECEKATAEALAKCDTAALHEIMAGLYEKKGVKDKAVEQSALALKLDPKLKSARLRRATDLLNKGATDEALADANALVSEEPCSDNLVFRSECFSKLGKHKEAIADLTKAIDTHGPDQILLKRAQLYLQLGLTDGALADCNKSIADHPLEGEAYLVRGRVYKMQNQGAKALEDFGRAAKLDQTLAEKCRNEGTTLSADQASDIASANTASHPSQETSGPCDRPVRDKWAVVVGVSKFKDSSIPVLKYSDKDARDFYNFLVNNAEFPADHVRLLLNEKATRERIWTEIGDTFLPRVVGPDDLVVLYFSSHGSPADRDVKRNNFLIAYDTKKTRLYADGIEMQKLLEELNRRTGADRVLIVLDACHSGAADPNAKALDFHTGVNLDQFLIGRGNIVLTSSQPDELSWESKRYSNGVFTKQLIDSLAKDPHVLGSFSKIKDTVGDEVRQDFGERQTPRLKADGWSGKDMAINVKTTTKTVISDTVKNLLEPDSR